MSRVERERNQNNSKLADRNEPKNISLTCHSQPLPDHVNILFLLNCPDIPLDSLFALYNCKRKEQNNSPLFLFSLNFKRSARCLFQSIFLKTTVKTIFIGNNFDPLKIFLSTVGTLSTIETFDLRRVEILSTVGTELENFFPGNFKTYINRQLTQALM